MSIATRPPALKLSILLLVFLLQGCASLMPAFEPPTVTVTAVRLIPSNKINPSFGIDLHIVNSNATALDVRGLAYWASIEGHPIFSGVGSNFPIIDGYGEGDISLTAATDLLAGLSLMADLMNRNTQNLNYKLELKLDVGAFTPAIRIEHLGKLSLRL